MESGGSKAKLKLECTDPDHVDFPTVVQDVFLGPAPLPSFWSDTGGGQVETQGFTTVWLE